MQRIPEPELMDEAEQARAYAEADFEEANSLFVDSFRARFGDGLVGRALDLGCGPADIICHLAQHYPDLRFDAVDGAATMLGWARHSLARHGIVDRISLLQRHLPCDDLPAARYEVITSNSLLHHMREADDFWAMVAAYAADGCRVLVMDLLRPDSPAAAEALVAQYAADAPPVLRQDFHNSLLAAYRPDEVAAQLARAGLEGLEVQVVSDRHWQVSGIA
jgi:cyclopropane fatty-acyl-phospholipid synthase-like methyltransferase